ncbi:hypothetical protein WA158_003761 [Blastocystis sp. Blastoise]
MSSSESEDEGAFSLFSSKASDISPIIEAPKVKESDTQVQKEITETSSKDESDALSFDELGLNEWLIKSADEVGIRQPTPVQRNCIPKILAGLNVIGIAETGSGKTATFALPILQNLAIDPYGIYAMIITPTRELAYQIQEQFEAFGLGILVRTCLLVGGQDQIKQGVELTKRPHIVIATPGRLLEHLSRSDGMAIHKLKYIVLDEADRLLDGSQSEEMKRILTYIPKESQYILTTATYNDAIKQLDNIKNRDIYVYEGNIETKTVSTLEEYYLLVPQQIKLSYFVYLLMHSIKKLQTEEEEEEEKKKDDKKKEKSLYKCKSAIVFCAKCKTAQMLQELLLQFEIPCVCLHSMLNQRRRIAALGKFKNAKANILICTDVASRGLDIPQVDLVINFDLPNNPRDYVHRVGRTARAGRSGTSVSMVTQYDILLLKNIEKTTGKEMSAQEGIEEENVLTLLGKVNKAERVAQLRLNQDGFYEKYKQIREDRRKKQMANKE